MSCGRLSAAGKIHFIVPCQIGVVNKQIVCPLSWNNQLSKTALGESYIMMTDRKLDAKKKLSLDVERVYNM